MNTDFDVVIIGAGVVGLAVAQALCAKGMSALVIERHDRYGVETSSRNSEVIHAGMYYTTGSLKAQLCVRGNSSIVAWCEAHNVPFKRLGKIIVATSPEEEGELDKILSRAKQNQVAVLEPVNQAWIAEREPNVIASAGLWSPNTGVLDSHAFMSSLMAKARESDAQFAFCHRLMAVDCSDVYTLHVEDNNGDVFTVTSSYVINSAGLDADKVAALVGLNTDDLGYKLTYVKGRYFRLRGRRVQRLIYPVPSPKLLGLGVHVTIDLGGGERLGPDTEILAQREQDYSVGEERAQAFYSAASRYLRGLTLEDLSPDYSGIRPKLTPKDGSVPDFIIQEESARGLPKWVNLVGIESPGLTCALEIAAMVSAMVG